MLSGFPKPKPPNSLRHERETLFAAIALLQSQHFNYLPKVVANAFCMVSGPFLFILIFKIMALKTPEKVEKTFVEADHKITVKWDKVADAAGYNFQFVNKDDATDIENVTAANIGTPTDTEGKTHVDITFTTAAELKQYKKLKDYLAQVQAKGATAEDNSEWGSEIIWDVEPTLAIKIGGKEFTLTKHSSGGDGIYKFPISKDDPLEITYSDLKDFVAGVSSSLVMPTTFPDGSPITSSLKIYEFVIDTKKKLFNLNIAVEAHWRIFEGLEVQSFGLVIKRTDGSL